MRYAFAGDRQISVSILSLLIGRGFKPLALMVSKPEIESHSKDLIELSKLEPEHVMCGSNFKSTQNIKLLKKLNLDYIIGIHFPVIISEEVLNIPRVGFLNLHPSYLPYNKGWHTPSWSIIENTPYGATLHFMSMELDGGDIIHQKQIKIRPDATANCIYREVLKLEYEVFEEVLEDIVSLIPIRSPQLSKGTSHVRKDLLDVQRIDFNEELNIGVLIDKLRALTTNDINEAAFFEANGKKYAVQVKIQEL